MLSKSLGPAWSDSDQRSTGEHPGHDSHYSLAVSTPQAGKVFSISSPLMMSVCKKSVTPPGFTLCTAGVPMMLQGLQYLDQMI